QPGARRVGATPVVGAADHLARAARTLPPARPRDPHAARADPLQHGLPLDSDDDLFGRHLHHAALRPVRLRRLRWHQDAALRPDPRQTAGRAECGACRALRAEPGENVVGPDLTDGRGAGLTALSPRHYRWALVHSR